MDDKTLAKELRAIVADRDVLTDRSELVAYERDGNTIFKKIPRAVVLPGSTDEVARIVRLLSAHDIAFIPRGAGTGLSSGVVPRNGEIMIGLSRMNRLIEVDLRNSSRRRGGGTHQPEAHPNGSGQGLLLRSRVLRASPPARWWQTWRKTPAGAHCLQHTASLQTMCWG